MSDLSKLTVPGPTIIALTKPFWDAASNGVLLIQKCRTCNARVFYPRPICPHCWADALEWTEVSGKGKLLSFSKIWKPGHVGWLPVTPYFVGIVELVEGPKMMSHILVDNGVPVVDGELIFKSVNVGGQNLPFFKPQMEKHRK